MAALNDWLKGISIHALREEGDGFLYAVGKGFT